MHQREIGGKIKLFFGHLVKDKDSTPITPPDGAQHHSESYKGDTRRDKFVEWLEGQRFEDGSSPLEWVEVQYGDTSPEDPVVCRHS